jgi:sugar phosphate isomerase/epimerase
MKTNPSRRDFCRAALTLGAAASAGLLGSSAARGIEPIRRGGKPRFRTSLVAYSLRPYFLAGDSAHRLNLFGFIDYCADQGFDAAELTGYYFPWPCVDEYLARVKQHAYHRGVAISGTSMGGEFASADPAAVEEQIAAVKAGLDRAAFLGAPYLRVFAGHDKAMAVPGAVKACIRAFEECADYGGRKGVSLGLENDGGILPDTVLEIVHGVKSPWFGLNLDLANFHTPDVYADVARCAPYAINVHYKMTIQEQGKAAVPMDARRMLDILRAANYQGYLAFEYEADAAAYDAIPGWKKQYEAMVAQG